MTNKCCQQMAIPVAEWSSMGSERTTNMHHESVVLAPQTNKKINCKLLFVFSVLFSGPPVSRLTNLMASDASDSEFYVKFTNWGWFRVWFLKGNSKILRKFVFRRLACVYHTVCNLKINSWSNNGQPVNGRVNITHLWTHHRISKLIKSTFKLENSRNVRNSRKK